MNESLLILWVLMMRGRSDGGQKKRLIASICVVALFLCFLYMYYDSSSQGASALEYGRSLRKLGSSYLGGDDDDTKQDGSVSNEEDSLVVAKSFPVCDDRHSEIIPCLDRNFIYQMRLKLDLSLMEHYERHCPPPERKFNCLIPPPSGYKVPIKWPKSRDEVWQANIPHTHLAKEKSDQNWMVVKGDKINFPGGGTHFHYGADKTVLDVGCGVASFGAYLLSSDIIAMSLAPNDVHQNQIQFALERGIPAYLGVLGTKRLPYPSRSFELAHCSRCRIDWLQRDGILLLELDRVLRPGGYFAYSSPEAYAQDEDSLRIWKEMSTLVERMCWRIAAKRNQTVAFSTYPRTYDLLHAWTVFSDIKSKGCSVEDLLLEMDRILRPTGFIIIRDKESIVESIKKYMKALHWEVVALEKVTTGSELDQDNEDGENNVVFIVRKKLWLTSESLRDNE
ncbi:hypothetical protein HID58_079098 [Brassica napus]|uniref:Methyltransferase n=1 Tax=Brassica napus TaxID=3708 RepID=A0ABQ7Y116_BRANA|nr:hypothetical protein HID58_079098 [Brassica napus]